MNFAKSLLLVVDVQNDFCPAYTSAAGVEHPEGALAVKNGCEVVASLNTLITAFVKGGGRIAATQDWHPAGHASFASSHPGKKPGDLIDLPDVPGQVLWPDHCVQGERGAAFHDDINLKQASLIIRKGFRPGLDSYSAFFENDRKTPTGLEGWMRGVGIDTIIIGGLATDYCVFYSASDAKTLGFNTFVVDEAVRGIDYPPGSLIKTIARMRADGIVFSASWDILEEF